MAHPERVDEPLERDLAPGRDGIEQVAHRQFAETLLLLEPDLRIARSQREDIGRLLDPTLLEEQCDLLLAETLDIEGAAGDEMLEVLDLLIGAGELAGAAGNKAPFPRRRRGAHDLFVPGAPAVPRGILLALGP